MLRRFHFFTTSSILCPPQLRICSSTSAFINISNNLQNCRCSSSSSVATASTTNNETTTTSKNNESNEVINSQNSHSSSAITLAPPPQKLRAKRWLEQNEIEKWTCLFDAAATVNTLLDDDIWESSARKAHQHRVKKQKESKENKNDRSMGAPMTNVERRNSLREEIRLTLLEHGIRREDLAATITGMGFWMRGVTDTQETIARHHQPWAFCKRHWQTLVTHPYPRKFCEVLTDHRSSARVMCGDVSGEQVRPEDIKSGIVVLDVTSGSGNAKKIVAAGSSEEEGIKLSSKSFLTFNDLTNFRRLLEMTFAHLVTALFIENHACRIFVEDRLVYLILCLVFQHLLERNACLEINLAHQVELTRQQQELQEVRKIMDPKMEMSSWVLIGSDPKYRDESDDLIWSLRSSTTKSEPGEKLTSSSVSPLEKLSPALVKLCQYAVLQKPNVIYYDESVADVVRVMEEEILFPSASSSSINENGNENEENDINSNISSQKQKQQPIIFVPMKNIATSWIDIVKTPYVSFFGPRAWECSLEFRKQILTTDINPTMGIEFTSRGKKSLRAYQKKLDAAIKREEELKKLKENKEEAQNGKLESAGFTGGRKRKILGLSENQNRQHIIRQKKRDALSAINNNSNKNKTNEEKDYDEEDDDDLALDFSKDDEFNEEIKNFKAHGEILAAVGINVDAKMMTRAYPQLRTPCGSGNSFRYRSVARSVLRRGTPIGGVFNSSLINTMNSFALLFGRGRKTERHAAPWSVTGKCVIDDLLPELSAEIKTEEKEEGKTTTKKQNQDGQIRTAVLSFDEIHSQKLVPFIQKRQEEEEEQEEQEKNDQKESKSTSSSSSLSNNNNKNSPSSSRTRSSLLLLQERTLEYLTGRAAIYECVPVIFGKINF